MRPRAAGGQEPDDVEQAILVDLWHLSRTVVSDLPYRDDGNRMARLTWVVNAFVKTHPEVPRKFVYIWSQDNLGHLLRNES